MTRSARWAPIFTHLATFTVVALLSAAGPVYAGKRIVIDANAEFSTSPSPASGQWFHNPVPLTLTGNLTSAPIDMGFTVNIAGQPYNTVSISENGFVSFGGSLPPNVGHCNNQVMTLEQ